MLNGELKNNFTISIVDDVTNLSLPTSDFVIPSDNYEMVIMGYGSDGMVSASKDIMKITGTGSSAFVQGYFEYDSKKSGGVTVSHLRISDKIIKAPYYIEQSEILVITKDTYLINFDMLDKCKEESTVLINTSKSSKELIFISFSIKEL